MEGKEERGEGMLKAASGTVLRQNNSSVSLLFFFFSPLSQIFFFSICFQQYPQPGADGGGGGSLKTIIMKNSTLRTERKGPWQGLALCSSEEEEGSIQMQTEEASRRSDIC